MYPVIEPAERAVLEEKLRTVFGSGAATTALLKIIDVVNRGPAAVESVVADFTQEEVDALSNVESLEPVAEVQVVESSP